VVERLGSVAMDDEGDGERGDQQAFEHKAYEL
jgi:hypothetical protein